MKTPTRIFSSISSISSISVLALALGACGAKEEIKKVKNEITGSTLTSESVAKDEAPKVVLTCALKNDPDDFFYVFRTHDKKYYLTKSADPAAEKIKFSMLGSNILEFNETKGEYPKGIEAGTAWVESGGKKSYMALVSNQDRRTLEIVRFEAAADQAREGTVNLGEGEMRTQSKVLFSSTHCVQGALTDPDRQREIRAEHRADQSVQAQVDQAKVNVKELVNDIQEEFAQVLDSPEASKESVDVIRQLVLKLR